MAEKADVSNDNLTITGKPVLVQNQLGIFYGFLEKSDTRNGTALLRDGFMVSPDNHITFTQYLDYLSDELLGSHWEIVSDFDESVNESEDEQPDDSILDRPLMPNEISITQDVFDEHKRDLSITDYASEGIFLVQRRTSSFENTRRKQSRSPLISLVNVVAIVAIAEDAIEHSVLRGSLDDIDRTGLVNTVDQLTYIEDISPLMTFGRLGDDINSLVRLSDALKHLDEADFTKVIASASNNESFGASASLPYILKSITDRIAQSETRELGAANKDILLKEVHDLVETLIKMPALVVNSERRVKQYSKD